MNFTYILFHIYLVMSFNGSNLLKNSNPGQINQGQINQGQINWKHEKADWENRVKLAKAEQAYFEKTHKNDKNLEKLEYLEIATKNRDEAKHIYELARKLPNPVIINTGFDIKLFKSAVKKYDEETATYNHMMKTLKKELNDAENILLEEEGKYYDLKLKLQYDSYSI